ncbi:MAG: terminase [Alphaproteobacteria bacterium]|nr:terminase [Alphaproteobacteria bacterium]
MSGVSKQRLLDALLRQKLSGFTEKCFYEVGGGQSYQHNWHLDAIAWHLEEVAKGNIRRLLITIQPRSLKSIHASVAFPAWLLGHNPGERIVCASYGQELAVKHANQCRNILKTDWYRRLFSATRIDTAKDTEMLFQTTRGGVRQSVTVGGALTGLGGSIFIIDDPMKAADANSQSARERVKTWFNQTLLSRLDNKREDKIVVVMQRLHVDDLAGHLLTGEGWRHLNLPAIAERKQRVQIASGKFYKRSVGDLLQPKREPQSVLAELKESMGTADFSAQYQQAPVPPKGNLVKRRWFASYTGSPPLKESYRDTIVQSWDTAMKGTDLADYSACVTALVRGEAIYIIDVLKERLDYPDLKRAVIRLKERFSADTVLIEDKGSGMSLIQDLQHGHIYANAIKTRWCA